jgi:hypothetical protein
MSQSQVGDLLAVKKAAVHNYETAIRSLDIGHARKLDHAWSTGGHFERLATHASRQHDSNWFQQLTRYERRSTNIRDYETIIVPGLVQTPAYALALIEASGIVDDVETAVHRRMERQTVLERPNPPRLQVLLEEELLCRPVGGPSVAREQLAHLLEMASRPNISIRVVPTEAGGHIGLDGPFKIIETATDTVAYLEAQRAGRLVRAETEVTGMTVAWERIGDQALPVPSSRRLISTVMEAMT